MSFLDLVSRRQSIRSYLNKPIPKDDILKCIEAARLAPSACNVQPWKFVVVDEKNLIDKIVDEACLGIYSMNKFIKSAAALIVVVSQKESFLRKIGSALKGTNYYLIDIGIACEHLVLQATELGIGSCWIGWFNEKKLKSIMQVPKDKKIDVIISLGFSEIQPSAKNRKELKEVLSYNKY